ncbi:hypothetical protein SAMN04489800_2518 [Pseudomonas deceptionensis]|uniref:Uncharacterized protein n=1 Tax=Pseudomonas deceptionensis TaxID=882211 RepID=A0A0J6GFB8_PSEDM|nr:hypothetical protein TR67_02615 [Pseudomonas deceptionensis]SEE86541.1 hypothetical protein SAMN04489800_2518 [Pseudomonas deceptionensis]
MAGFGHDRSESAPVEHYQTTLMLPVAAEERSEAAIEMVRHCDEAVANSGAALGQVCFGIRFDDGYAADRSLAALLSGYRSRGPPLTAS